MTALAAGSASMANSAQGHVASLLGRLARSRNDSAIQNTTTVGPITRNKSIGAPLNLSTLRTSSGCIDVPDATFCKSVAFGQDHCCTNSSQCPILLGALHPTCVTETGCCEYGDAARNPDGLGLHNSLLRSESSSPAFRA